MLTKSEERDCPRFGARGAARVYYLPKLMKTCKEDPPKQSYSLKKKLYDEQNCRMLARRTFDENVVVLLDDIRLASHTYLHTAAFQYGNLNRPESTTGHRTSSNWIFSTWKILAVIILDFDFVLGNDLNDMKCYRVRNKFEWETLRNLEYWPEKSIVIRTGEQQQIYRQCQYSIP